MAAERRLAFTGGTGSASSSGWAGDRAYAVGVRSGSGEAACYEWKGALAAICVHSNVDSKASGWRQARSGQ